MQHARRRFSSLDFRAWGVVLVLLVLLALAMLNRQVILLMVDPIRASFGVSDSLMGLLKGPAFALAFLVGTILMGWIVDRYSPRWAVCLAVLLWSAATLWCGLAGSFAELLLARGLVGLGQAALQPASWSIVSRFFPPHRLAFAISVVSTGVQLGAGASFLLGGLLLSEAQVLSAAARESVGLDPWQFVFIIAALPGIVLAWLIFLVPTRSPQLQAAHAEGCAPAPDLAAYLSKNRRFLLFHVLGFSFLSVLINGTAAWAPTLLLRSFELDANEVGVMLALIAVTVGVAGFLFNGWVADQAFKRGHDDAHLAHFSRVAAILAVIGGVGFFVGGSLGVVVACLVAITFLQSFSGVAGAVLQIVTPLELRGRVSALFIMTYGTFGMVVGPSLVALLADTLGGDRSLAMGMAINCAICGGAAAVCLRMGRSHAANAVQDLRAQNSASQAAQA